MAKTSQKLTKIYLYINGVQSADLELVLIKQKNIIARAIISLGTRTEKFLPHLIKFLKSSNVTKPTGILVAQGGGSFSRTRLACAIANALAYAWGIPITTTPVIGDLTKLSKERGRLAKNKLALPKYNGPGVG